ncbi:chemotaxis protein CheD [Anaerobacillus isosaccharinicus]|uniref:Probable chemoreceptor glutamine deamidase CheD n=1 Tax=Anaerobacillus isosaccharinicus TaxID=1532552 RepID=A0A1S2L6X4_9BACI|nr:chemotaxis protein CheD [Anaerobacillus isosaccharinicus]MBA5587312.1 chemotaxis protein CheD [Anaerobacillus isosaccharinicus]QOY34495.1 chemotaxis protein CheD [Anaerobacillus isosaccharinicus]
MDEIVKVGMADLNVAKPPKKIRTSGLGSCVGVVIYDETTKICGMAHVMLPNSSLGKSETMNKAKYADTALDVLLENLSKLGAKKSQLKAKLAGGSQMFKFSSSSEMMRIGPRNVEAVKEKLRELRISIVAEDVGGSSGRTIEFDPVTSKLSIRTVSQGVSEI